MIKNIFKPAWESESANTRLTAVNKLNDKQAEELAVLKKLALHDVDETVRQAALDQLTRVVDLADASSQAAQLSGDSANTVLATCLDKLAQCLKNPETPLADITAAFENSDKQTQQYICANSHIDEFRQQHIVKLANDENALLAILQHSQFSKTRQQICELLTTESALEQAKPLIAGKDKRAERMVKDKLDAIKREHYAIQEENAQRNTILADIETLASRAQRFVEQSAETLDRSLWRQDHLSQSRTLHHRWQTLHEQQTATQASADEKQQFDHAAKTIESANQKLTQLESIEQAFPVMVDELSQLISHMSNPNHLLQVSSAENVQTLEQRWQENLRLLPASNAQQLAFDTQLNQAKALVSATQQIKQRMEDMAMLELFDEQATIPQDPSQLKALNNQIEQLAQFAPEGSQLQQAIIALTQKYQAIENQQHDAFHHSIDQLHKHVNNVMGSVRVKDLPAAFGKLRRFHNQIAQFLTPYLNTENASSHNTPSTIPDAEDQSIDLSNDQINQQFDLAQQTPELSDEQKHVLTVLQSRVAEVQQHVKELDDWKSFATEPQCLELCEKMEALAQNNEKIDPPQQAKQLSELLNQWKKLGACSACDTHWPRFKTAMDTANEPCAAYFVELKAQREENLQQLKELGSAMQNLYNDASNADTINSNDYLKRIYHLDNEWKKYQNVERAKGQKAWQTFKGFRDQIYAVLEPQLADNLNRKEALTKRAEKVLLELTENGISDTSMDTLKQLQSAWKQIGVAKKHQDNKIWKKFKAQCDGIYAEIKKSRDTARAQDDQLIDEHYKLIKEITALATSATSTSELERSYTELQTRYSELQPLGTSIPEKKRKAVEKKLRFASNDIEKSRQRLKSKKQDSELATFMQQANIANQIRQQASDDKKAALKAQWQELSLSDTQLKTAATAIFDSAWQNDSVDQQQLEHEKRLLCIQAELASDSPTPKEDQALRMQFQLQQMQTKGLGKTQQNRSKRDFIIAWYHLPMLNDKQEQGLVKRFEQVIEKLR